MPARPGSTSSPPATTRRRPSGSARWATGWPSASESSTSGSTSPIRCDGECLGRIEELLLMTSVSRATVAGHVANLTGGIGLMAIHLTPTELAREAGMERREVIEKCMEMGVPIFQGRIDKTLFLANISEQAATSNHRQVATA